MPKHQAQERMRAREYLTIPGLSFDARPVIVCEISARKLSAFVNTCGPAAVPATPKRLRQIIAAGIAQFGGRATREMAESEGAASTRLRPWEAALEGYPEWAIAGAFTYCNQGIHPPRPAEVASACQRAAGSMIWLYRRAVDVLAYVEAERPQWLLENLQ